MPVLHVYRDKRGMYIKARHQGSMVTYQLALPAVAELLKYGLGEGSKLSQSLLHTLIANGLAYTHGTGPGDAQVLPATSTPKSQVIPHNKLQDSSSPKFDPRSTEAAVPKTINNKTDRLYPASCYTGDDIPLPSHLNASNYGRNYKSNAANTSVSDKIDGSTGLCNSGFFTALIWAWLLIFTGVVAIFLVAIATKHL